MFNATGFVLCISGIVICVGLSFLKPRKGKRLSPAASVGLVGFKLSCSIAALLLSLTWPLLSAWDLDTAQMAFKAVLTDDSRFVARFIMPGDNVNIAAHDKTVYFFNEEGDTLLIVASRHGCIKNARYLLSLGADKDIRNARGETALDIARKNGHKEICQILETE